MYTSYKRNEKGNFSTFSIYLHAVGSYAACKSLVTYAGWVLDAQSNKYLDVLELNQDWIPIQLVTHILHMLECKH